MINDASVVIGGGNWGIKEADVLGYKLINGDYYAREIDFANSTAAGTYTDSTGVIRKAPYNLLQYSEQFDNASWSKINTTVTANSINSPSGILNADTIIDNSTNSIHVCGNDGGGAGAYTLSFYAKANTLNRVGLLTAAAVNTTLASTAQVFDLSNGTVVNTISGVTATITNVGDGWYRCSTTLTALASGTYFITCIKTGTNIVYIGSGESLYLWGAQLVEGTEALPYFPTTTRLNVPRIDYRNADGSLSTVGRLLIEPQRTNLVTYSEQLDNAAWVKTDATVTANTSVSPDGYTNADKLVENSANAIHFVGSNSGSVTAGSHTASVFAKAAERNILQLFFNGSANSTAYANFNLTTGAVTASASSTATIKSFGNGWYRCTITATLSTSVVPLMYCCLQTSPTAARAESYLGNSTSGLLLWGAQAEAAAYATTYIPTTTAAVTRNADVASKTGVSSWIGQTQGTIFAEINVAKLLGIQSRYILVISDNTANNRIYIAFSGVSSNILRARIFSGGVQQASIDTGTISSLGTYKLAFAYNNNDAVLYVNGVQIGTDTSVTVPACSKLNVCTNQAGANPFDDGVTQSMLFQTRLTNSQLQSLTTL